jgi:hypothetical protein
MSDPTQLLTFVPFTTGLGLSLFMGHFQTDSLPQIQGPFVKSVIKWVTKPKFVIDGMTKIPIGNHSLNQRLMPQLITVTQALPQKIHSYCSLS